LYIQGDPNLLFIVKIYENQEILEKLFLN